jgi:tetrahydromethanopterin S-methyltransferase subunit A
MNSPRPQQANETAGDAALEHLSQAAAAGKCWHCGCLHGSLRAIEGAYPEGIAPKTLAGLVELARSRLSEVKYDCLGCEVCWPALAINALGVEGDACPSEAASAREGWPPLPGAYTVLRHHAPVAVCTLTDEGLTKGVVAAGGAEIAVVGTMHTENLGIERLVQNTLANPNIRFLVLCGADSRQAVGHLPGQSLVALARAGVDEGMRIIGAQGRRPVLHNVSREAVEHFRRSVELVDRIGETSVPDILAIARSCAARNPGSAEPFAAARTVGTVAGYLPERMISDPAGYFVVFPDCGRGLLMLEHYRSDGLLDMVIEGRSPAELYIPAVEKGLVSRLDHAAYLGQELARAEQALLKGGSYVQSAAPELGTRARVVNEPANELSACGCGCSCRGNGS